MTKEQLAIEVIERLKKEYPEVQASNETDIVDLLIDINAENPQVRFIFVLDEWDYIFHQDFVTDQDRKSYLQFLRSLLKDRSYVLLAYMTGILPIAKYSSGSELNMFLEYTMITEERFSDSFGFTDTEVDMLYQKYLHRQSDT